MSFLKSQQTPWPCPVLSYVAVLCCVVLCCLALKHTGMGRVEGKKVDHTGRGLVSSSPRRGVEYASVEEAAAGVGVSYMEYGKRLR